VEQQGEGAEQREHQPGGGEDAPAVFMEVGQRIGDRAAGAHHQRTVGQAAVGGDAFLGLALRGLVTTMLRDAGSGPMAGESVTLRPISASTWGGGSG
jgi:hypothetical protein